VRKRLTAVSGVTLFDLGEVGKIGLVIEAGDLDEAHRKLRVEIREIEGVLGVWPVYAHMEPELSHTKCQKPD
jgi:nitrate reductase NapAB chaperone NapD